MLAPLVLALAFWAAQPAGAADPVCPGGIQVREAPVPANIAAQIGPDAMADAWAGIGSRDCHIWVNRRVWRWLSSSYQCEVLAHEIGHMWFGLEHSETGVMSASTATTRPPGVCYGRAVR